MRSRPSTLAIDFDALLSHYTGNALVDRLIVIAERTTDDVVALTALRHAKRVLEEAVNPFTMKPPAFANGALYQRAQATAKRRNISKSGVEFTDAWIEENARKSDAELRKLESGLTDLLTERVKENLRMQYVELGDHYYDRGDLKNALACYMRTRDYCSTPKHIVSMCLSVIAVSLEAENFAHVNVHANKALTTLDLIDGDEGVIVLRAKLACSSGIAALRMGRFKEAANKFTEIPMEIGTLYASMCASKDVATYGTLCALASFDRNGLRELVLDNKKSAFRAHLEAAAEVREVVNDFYNSKYTSCFATLDSMRDVLALDIHLGAHVETLYKQIRERALIQYVEPYISVDLTTMAMAFNTTPEALQEELVRLIATEKIRARIDATDNTLRATGENQRLKVFEQVISDGEKFEEETRAAILRVSLLRNDVITTALDGARARERASRSQPS